MCKANHLPTYQELLSAYFCVQQENEKLKAEIGRLWQRLSAVWRLSDDGKSQEQIVTMTTPQLSVEERVTLFRSLFKGREDVFARRWYSKATHKSGYQPVCLNEWRNSVCDKRKCSGCRKTIYKQREEAMGNANARTTRRK